MVAGAQASYGDHWTMRVEFGLLGKFSIMAMISYRFGIPFLPKDKSATEPVPEPDGGPGAEPAPPSEPPAPLWQLPSPEPTPPAPG